MQDAQSAGFSAGGKLCRARCAVLSMDGKGRVYTYYIGEPSQSSLRDARFPLLSLRDIFPRPGEVFPLRGSFICDGGKVSGSSAKFAGMLKLSPAGGRRRAAPDEGQDAAEPSQFAPAGRVQLPLSGELSKPQALTERVSPQRRRFRRKQALQLSFSSTTSPRENGIPERPQTLRYSENINNSSSNIVRAKRRQFQIVTSSSAVLPAHPGA